MLDDWLDKCLPIIGTTNCQPILECSSHVEPCASGGNTFCFVEGYLLMKPSVATRNTSDSDISSNECTEFVLHKSKQSIFDGIQRKIIDFSEVKLRKMAEDSTDIQQRLTLQALINDYIKGRVAIGWRRGQPCYLKITKDK